MIYAEQIKEMYDRMIPIEQKKLLELLQMDFFLFDIIDPDAIDTGDLNQLEDYLEDAKSTIDEAIWMIGRIRQ